MLKFDKKDNTHECMIFGHKDVIAVKNLGGSCYRFQDEAEAEEEEADEVELSKFLYSLQISLRILFRVRVYKL